MPENSIEGVIHAVGIGVTTVELDVVISANNKVVVSHEPWISSEYCLDKNGNELTGSREDLNMYNMRYGKIKKYDCGSKNYPLFPEQRNFKVSKPLLKTLVKKALEANPLINFNIEIKSNEEAEGKFHPPIDKYSALVHKALKNVSPQQVTIQSFDERIIRLWRKEYPHYKVSYLVGSGNYENYIDNLGILPDIYSPHYKGVNEEMIEFFHGNSLRVIPWTVNEKEDMRRLIDMGVDGIITDYPNRLINLLD